MNAFLALCNDGVEIKSIVASKSISGRRTIYNRPYSGLLVKSGGVTAYGKDGKTISVGHGEVIFLCAGAVYNVEELSPGGAYTVNFITKPSNEPFIEKITLPKSYDPLSAFETTFGSWQKQDSASMFVCMSRLYSLFAEAAAAVTFQKRYTTSNERARIAPAMKYLRENLSDSSLDVGTLCTMAGVSDTYFRKIFRSIYGVNPVEYITRERIKLAKSLFQGGNCASVSDIAYASGFSDSFYFSKVFKKETGLAPSEYQKLLISD